MTNQPNHWSMHVTEKSIAVESSELRLRARIKRTVANSALEIPSDALAQVENEVLRLISDLGKNNSASDGTKACVYEEGVERIRAVVGRLKDE